MRNVFFPTTIIDGFFENPDEIRKIGLQQEYSNAKSDYPGMRTRPLSEINPYLFETIVFKFMSIFYGAEGVELSASMYFQMIDKEFGRGSVHRDRPIATAIIYLNPNQVSGTSLYEKKNILIDTVVDKKYESYVTNRKDEKTRNEINDQYNEVINVKGLYNRAVLFDSHLYHAAHDYHGENLDDSRLTIITFFDKINSEKSIYPIQRLYKNAHTIL
jgi:hypothetical protein